MSNEEYRGKIVETALQMFNTRGTRGVTMDDIAQSLHISKRTLYETFANKEELLAECLKLVHNRIGQLHCQINHKVDEPLLVTTYMIRVGSSINHKYSRLLDEAERYYPDIHDRYFKVHTETFRSTVQRGFDYARQHNYLRPDADTDVAIDFLCDLIQRHRLSEADNPQDYMHRLNEVCFTFLRGLMTVETIERYEKSENRFKQLVLETDIE